jgi:hypothetical protein
MPPRFTITGAVEPFGSKQINIPVTNADELRNFYHQHAPRRNLDWAAQGELLFTVSKKRLVEQCRPGDQVEYVVEIKPSRGGPYASGLDLRVLGAN